MEIKVSQNQLARALNVVSRVAAGSRTTLPILNNVLIRADDGKISLSTTNLDIAVVSYTTGNVVKSGVITVPVRILGEFVTNLPKGEDIVMKLDGMKVVVSAGKYKSVINGVAADDFPEIPVIDEATAVTFRVGVDEFKETVSDVAVASSNDMTRPVLTGVYWYTVDKNLYLVTTDGYRLAEKRFISGVESEVKVVIPASSLQEVVRSLAPEDDELEILIDESQVKFRFKDTEITSKLIDGSFPDYRQLIPKKTDINVVVKRDELVRVVKLAALFAKEVGGSITCETKEDGNNKGVFVVSSVANEYGENNSEIVVTDVKDGKVTLNSKFLLDAINVISADEVSFGFSGKLAPVLLRGTKDKDYLHIIMPLKS